MPIRRKDPLKQLKRKSKRRERPYKIPPQNRYDRLKGAVNKHVLELKLLTVFVLVFITTYVLLRTIYPKSEDILTSFPPIPQIPIVPNIDISNLIPSLMTLDYQRVDLDVIYSETQGVVLLTSDCSQIRAFVEPDEAQSIYRGINNIIVARPNAHDIAADAFDGFGIKVIMVKISDVRDGSFYGTLVLEQGKRIYELEARPSDATAIAVRTGAPIYVKNKVLEDYGEDICS